MPRALPILGDDSSLGQLGWFLPESVLGQRRDWQENTAVKAERGRDVNVCVTGGGGTGWRTEEGDRARGPQMQTALDLPQFRGAFQLSFRCFLTYIPFVLKRPL